MPTSNWQQIPFCIDVLMKIAPARVLDVGIGFGRWGMIVREFCDVWYGRPFRDRWTVHVEGIEAFPRYITDYHRQFYDEIHIGDAAEIIPRLLGRWNVVIFGDVLEHFPKDVARDLLRTCLKRADYVLINIPTGEEYEQGEVYENPFERHLAVWEAHNFDEFPLVRRVMFLDYGGRPHASVCLSWEDPKDLRDSLYSQIAEYENAAVPPAVGNDLERILTRLGQQTFELRFVKQSLSYRLALRLRRSATWRVLRRLKGSKGIVEIRATGVKNASSQGTEVWLLQANWEAGGQPIPWDFISHDENWIQRDHDAAAYGRCLLSDRGTLAIRLGTDPELRFLRHPWSGIVELRRHGSCERVDLHAPVGDIVTVHPARTPMLHERPSDRTPAAVVAGTVAREETSGVRRHESVGTARQQEFIEAVRRD